MSTACGNAGTAAMAGASAASMIGLLAANAAATALKEAALEAGVAAGMGPVGLAVGAGMLMFTGLQTMTAALGMKKKMAAKRKEITDKCNQLNHTAKQQKFIDDLIVKLQKDEEIEQDTKDQLNGMILQGNNMKDQLKHRQNAYMFRLAIFIIINIVAVSVLLIMKDF